MAIQELNKEEINAVSGAGALDLSGLLCGVVGLAGGLVTTAVGLVGGLVNTVVGLAGGLLGGLLGCTKCK